VAIHIHKRTFRRGVNDILRILLIEAASDLFYFHTLGCHAFVHVPRGKRPKIAPSARESNFVGYSPDSPAWLVWIPNTKNVLANNRNVAFNETGRLGRFDAPLPDEWDATTHEGRGISASSIPTQVAISPPEPPEPQEELHVSHSDSDSSDDDSLASSSDTTQPLQLQEPKTPSDHSVAVTTTRASSQHVSARTEPIRARPCRNIRPKVRLPATNNFFPTREYQPTTTLSLY
jgi:hypothetical protein